MSIQDFRVVNGLSVDVGGVDVRITHYDGAPEGNITGGIGSLCTDTTTGKLYKKTSGTGNTGWAELSGVDAINEFDWKEAVNTVSTENITLEDLQTINGVSLAAGDRVLVTGQTDPAENGIYTVVDGDAWTRTADADDDTDVTAGMAVVVSDGDSAGAIFVLTTNDPITVGTTGLSFSLINPVYTAGTGISITDNVVSATPYTGASGIIVTDFEITATPYTAGTNVSIDNYVISATDTTYTAGTDIDITAGVISSTYSAPEYTAGDGIDITSYEVSATPYTAGSGILVDDFEISAEPYTAGPGIEITDFEVAKAGFAQGVTAIGASTTVIDDGWDPADGFSVDWGVSVANGTNGMYDVSIHAVEFEGTIDWDVYSVLKIGTIQKPTFTVDGTGAGMTLKVDGNEGYTVTWSRQPRYINPS